MVTSTWKLTVSLASPISLTAASRPPSGLTSKLPSMLAAPARPLTSANTQCPFTFTLRRFILSFSLNVMCVTTYLSIYYVFSVY